MVKSIIKDTGRPVVILDPQWNNQIDALRNLVDQNVLVCQKCNQSVRVHAGEELTAGREEKTAVLGDEEQP